MVEGGMKCVKFLLFVFNLLFFITGLTLLVVGILIKTRLINEFVTFFEGQSLNSEAIALIIVGCIILIIGFFGCCGAIKENYCMIMTFAVLLAILFIAQIAIGIIGFKMIDTVEEKLGNELLKTLKQYNSTDAKIVKLTWDKMQKQFTCCGVNGVDDWAKEAKLANPPESCCKKPEANCSANKSDLYTDGCINGFKAWVKQNIYIVAGITIGLAFIQIFGILFACCLGRAIKAEYEVV